MEGFFEWMLESSLLVAMILVIRRMFMGKIRYAAIYALWLIVLLRFIIPVNFIPAPINIGNVFSDVILSGITSDSRGYGSEASVNLPQGVISEATEENTAGMYSAGILSENENSNNARLLSEDNRRQTAGRFVIYCSMAVSAVFLLWITASNICMSVRLKRRRIVYGRRKGLDIYTVCGIKTPCLYGLLHPAIYIPESLVSGGNEERMDGQMQVTGDELEQIIMHEYVHYMHRDHIWAVIRIVLISVYWFHPFLWAAAICSKKDAELFCDETVVGRIGEEKRICYGEMLIRLAQDTGWADFRYSMTPMSRRGKEMKHRILAISTRKRYSVWLMVPLVLAAALSLCLTCGTGAMKTKDGDACSVIRIPEIILQYNGADTGVMSDGPDGTSYEKMHKQPVTEVSEKQLPEEDVTLDAGVNSEDYEQAFSNYISLFTEAVNTGNTDNLHQVLSYGSRVYEQQCSMAQNYYNRGIREEIKSYAIVSVQVLGENQVDIYSKERIKVYYADETSKVVRQEYKYTCENVDGNWIITDMSDIDDGSEVQV